MKTKVRNFEDSAWADYCVNYPGMHIAPACLKNVTPYQFWCLADNYPYFEVACTFRSGLRVVLDSIGVYHGTLAQMVPSV